MKIHTILYVIFCAFAIMPSPVVVRCGCGLCCEKLETKQKIGARKMRHTSTKAIVESSNRKEMDIIDTITVSNITITPVAN